MKTVRSVLEDLAKSAQCANYTNDEGDFCIECFSERITQALADLKEVLVPTEKSHPKLYHYVCHGGSCVGPMVDKWGNEEVYFCNSAKPDGGWINAPNCKTCTGNLPGVFESPLTEREKAWNACRTEILKRFDNQPNGGGGK